MVVLYIAENMIVQSYESHIIYIHGWDRVCTTIFVWICTYRVLSMYFSRISKMQIMCGRALVEFKMCTFKVFSVKVYYKIVKMHNIKNILKLFCKSTSRFPKSASLQSSHRDIYNNNNNKSWYNCRGRVRVGGWKRPCYLLAVTKQSCLTVKKRVLKWS